MQDSAEGLICTPVPPGATFFDELADVLLQRNPDLLESGDLSPLRVLVPALPMAVELRTALLRAALGSVAADQGAAARMAARLVALLDPKPAELSGSCRAGR